MSKERNDYLIKSKFYQYLLPSVMMVLALQAGDIVDSVIVAHLLGSGAMAAITLCLPVLNVLQMIPFLLAVGGSTVTAVLLGKMEKQKARQTFTLCFIVELVITVLMAITAPFVSEPIAMLLSGSTEIATSLEHYIIINIAGIPLLGLSLLVAHFLNVDNHPKLGSALFIIANIANLVLDYVLIKFADLELYGSALATILGYTIGMVVLIPYLMDKHRMLHFTKPPLKFMPVLKDVAKAGLPTLLFMLMIGIRDVTLNSGVVRILGDDAMSIYAVCITSVLIAELLIGGIIGLIPTICGVLYGEKDYFGIKKIIQRVIKYGLILTLLLTIFVLVFPELVVSFFAMDDPELAIPAQTCMRIYCLGFICYFLNKFTQTYYQTILQSLPATLVTVFQGFIFVVPATFAALLLGFDLKGVCAAAAISELLSFVSINLFRIVMQKRKRLPEKGFLMLPAENADAFDYTIHGEIHEAVDISKDIIEFCQSHQLNKKVSNALGIAAEELVVNIANYGYSGHKRNYIDLCLVIDKDKVLLRLRDDGVPFDPTSWKSEKQPDDHSVSGLELIRALTPDITYSRLLNMNNTIIEVVGGKL